MYLSIQFIALTSTLLVGICSGFGTYHWTFKAKLLEHRQKQAEKSLQKDKQGLLHNILNVPESMELGGPYPDQYHTQPLDHFDAGNKDTYEQRYWVNQDNWQKADGPVFLYIGGEGGLNSMTVQSGEHVNLAKKYGALVFAVEHRYYGQSINDDGLKLENMKYLSSQQALSDLASFHRFASQKYGLTEDNIWICYGGSYPGSLSAWFRLKYPHLVYAAIASSAPVQAKVNFEGYNSVVTHSLSDALVNGSSQCVQNIKKAFQNVDLLLAQTQYEKLSKDFQSCEVVKDVQDASQLTSNLADVFMSTVQYNAEMPGFNITGLCQAMTKPADPYKNLADLNDFFLDETKTKCADNSWDSMIAQISNTTVDRSLPGGVAMRQWLYQTCTQFGYYQTCDANTTCIFSRAMTLQSNLDVCQQVFKIDADEVQRRVDFTNDYYGSKQTKGTRIVFVNGSVDPWHALSVLHDLSASETAIYIPGTAHCANMGNDKASDPQALREARKMIDAQIGRWLKQAGKASKV